MYLCLIWYPSLTSGLLSRVATVMEINDRKGQYINLKNWFNQFSIASHISVNENQSVKGYIKLTFDTVYFSTWNFL